MSYFLSNHKHRTGSIFDYYQSYHFCRLMRSVTSNFWKGRNSSLQECFDPKYRSFSYSDHMFPENSTGISLVLFSCWEHLACLPMCKTELFLRPQKTSKDLLYSKHKTALNSTGLIGLIFGLKFLDFKTYFKMEVNGNLRLPSTSATFTFLFPLNLGTEGAVFVSL